MTKNRPSDTQETWVAGRRDPTTQNDIRVRTVVEEVELRTETSDGRGRKGRGRWGDDRERPEGDKPTPERRPRGDKSGNGGARQREGTQKDGYRSPDPTPMVYRCDFLLATEPAARPPHSRVLLQEVVVAGGGGSGECVGSSFGDQTGPHQDKLTLKDLGRDESEDTNQALVSSPGSLVEVPLS